MDNPIAYAEGHSMQRSDNMYALNMFLSELNWPMGSPESIVDIGCGDGEFTTNVLLQAAPKGSKILGVDISQKMIHYAEEKYGVRNRNVDFKHIDLLGNENDMKKYLGCFDTVTSFFCLQWVTKHKGPMTNIHKLLRPGGSALLVFPVKHPVYTMYEETNKIQKWKDHLEDVPKYFSQYITDENPAETFSNILSDVGFSILHCEAHELQYQFQKEKEMRDTVQGIQPYLKFVPENERYELFEDSVKEMKKIIANSSLSKDSLKMSYKITIAYVKKPFNILK